MNKYLLDTNICIFHFKGKYRVEQRLQQAGFENCAISEITLAELVYGAECSADIEKNMNIINNFIRHVRVLPVLNAIGTYAKEKALLRKTGKMIDDLDIFIGATAIANNMILVTDNEKHLYRLSEIQIEKLDSKVIYNFRHTRKHTAGSLACTERCRSAYYKYFDVVGFQGCW